MKRSRPFGSASSSPTAGPPSSPEIRSASICMNAIKSNSSTSVSATSTKIFARRSADTVLIVASRPSRVGCSCGVLNGVPLEAEAAGHDVVGNLAQRAARGESVGADTDQRLGERYPELDHHHALRLEKLG